MSSSQSGRNRGAAGEAGAAVKADAIGEQLVSFPVPDLNNPSEDRNRGTVETDAVAAEAKTQVASSNCSRLKRGAAVEADRCNRRAAAEPDAIGSDRELTGAELLTY